MKKNYERVLQGSSPGQCHYFTAQSIDTFNAACGGVHAVQAAWPGPDTLGLLLRASAEQLIVEVTEAEMRLFRAQFTGLRDAQGREMIVRNGFQPARELSTPIGQIAVRLPKLRRRAGGRVAFRSVFIPLYTRRVEAVDALGQCKYLDALRSRNVAAALEALFNGRIRYVPTPVMEHLRGWWAPHCEDLLAQAGFSGLDATGWSESRKSA